jgi:hypothetical protein
VRDEVRPFRVTFVWGSRNSDAAAIWVSCAKDRLALDLLMAEVGNGVARPWWAKLASTVRPIAVSKVFCEHCAPAAG